MDWTTLVPLLVGAAVSLGAVWLTHTLADRREMRRERERREEEAVADLRTEARRVADLFLAESIEVQRIAAEVRDGNGPDDFDTAYKAHLYGESLYRLGQAISMLPDADARGQLRLIVASLPDRMIPSRLARSHDWQWAIPILLNTGQDISSAYARGERPDLDDLKWYRKIEAAYAKAEGVRQAWRARRASRLQESSDGDVTEGRE